MIDFGSLINIFNLYSNTYSVKMANKNILIATKSLRNASAHNSCLIDDLSRKFSKDKRHIDNSIIKYAKEIGKFNSKQIDSHKNKTFVYTVLCLLYLFDKFCSKKSKDRQYKKLYNLFLKQLYMMWKPVTSGTYLGLTELSDFTVALEQ